MLTIIIYTVKLKKEAVSLPFVICVVKSFSIENFCIIIRIFSIEVTIEHIIHTLYNIIGHIE